MAQGPPAWFGRLRQGLEKMRREFGGRLKDALAAGARLDAALLEDLEALLVQADAGIPATTDLLGELARRARESGARSAEAARAVMEEIIAERLAALAGELSEAARPPTVYLLVGVNGTGKTTSLAKLARRFRAQGRSVLLAAADTFRAAAAEQLVVWGERLGVPVIRQAPGADPAAVAFDAVRAALARGIDVVLVDTAGRLHTRSNLMDELAKLRRVVARELPGAPHEVLLVLDATTGLNAVQQARLFQQSVGVTGIILTKLDGTAKGGVLLAVAREVPGVPVKLIGVGEGPDDLQPFDPAAFARALFD